MKISLGKWHIRSYEKSDIPALLKYADNRKIWIRLTDRFPHPYTAADAKNWIEYLRQQAQETHFAIATDEELIGSIGFDILAGVHCKTASLGYWLGEPYWGKGIITEAARSMTNYIFSNYGVVRIQATVFESNLASMRVLEKAGYTNEARLRKHVSKDERIRDLFVYAILRHEWES